MRLVDADALERKLMVMSDEDLCEDCCYNVVNVIAEMSPVEQTAEWLLSRPHHFRCSGCGAQWGQAVIGMRYCPTCGRKMTLSEEERKREWPD